MIATLTLHSISTVLAGQLLNGLLDGLVIAFLAWAVLRLSGHQGSGTRFAVWFGALLTIAVSSLAGHWPSVNTAGASAGSAMSAITLSSTWAVSIFVTWGVMAFLALIRVVVGLWKLRKLRSSCVRVAESSLDPVLQETLSRATFRREIALCTSNQVHVPTAVGFIKPIVIFPEWSLQELSTAQVNALLVHELAHLSRWDDWTNLIQKVLRAALFFHPAVWWLDRQLSLEREMACDDAVLAQTNNPRFYAQCLVAVAEKSFLRRTLALAQAAVHHVRQTSLRITQILDSQHRFPTGVWKRAATLVVGLSVTCAFFASRTPTLVTFEDSPAHGVAVLQATSPLPRSDTRHFADARNGKVITSKVTTDNRIMCSPQPSQSPSVVAKSIAKAAVVKAMVAKAAVSRRDASRFEPIQAGLKTPDLMSSGPLNSVPQPGNQSAAKAVFVVIESEQLGEFGPRFWSIHVFHLTIYHPQTQPTGSENPRKSI